MAVMDEFKKEREAIKNASLGVRLGYFWYYYKIQVIIVVCILVFGGKFIYDMVNQDECILYVTVLNCSTVYDDSAYCSEIEDYIGAGSGQCVTINSSLDVSDSSGNYNSLAALAAYQAVDLIDVMIAEEATVFSYSQQDILIDITTVLSEEQMEYYGDSLYYIDYALIESGYYDSLEYEELLAQSAEEAVPVEEMEKPMAVGIYITPTEAFSENYSFKYGDPIFVIYESSSNIENALMLLDFICGYTS